MPFCFSEIRKSLHSFFPFAYDGKEAKGGMRRETMEKKQAAPPQTWRWIGKAVAIVALLGVIFLFLDWRLHPVVESMVTNQARITSVEAINGAVMEELTANSVSYTDLVDIERAESGQILAVTTDMNQMNQLKASILQRVQEQLGEHLDTGCAVGNAARQ